MNPKPRFFAFAAALGLMAGCVSVPEFAQPDRSWTTSTGQLQYSGGGRRVVGEVVVSRKGGDVSLEFTKGGSVPLIKMSRQGEFARADGPFARGSWWGRADKAPDSLAAWVQKVPPALAGDKPLRGRMEVAGVHAGEKFIFVFAR